MPAPLDVQDVVRVGIAGRVPTHAPPGHHGAAVVRDVSLPEEADLCVMEEAAVVETMGGTKEGGSE